MMKALVLSNKGEPLLLKNEPVPSVGAGFALVRIKAAAFNRRDWWIQQGQYAGLRYPIILGSDGAGIVEQVADDECRAWVGKEVIINPALGWEEDSDFQPKVFSILGLPENGAFAEYVSVPVVNLYEKPTYLSFEEASALPLGGLTAYRAVFRKAELCAGESVLISGIGGGVATFALQWAVHAGAQVWVTSSSEVKLEMARSLGAMGGVNYREDSWADQLQAEAGGFDVIIDSALGDGFASFLDLANPGGRIVFFGGTAGNLPPLNGRKIFWKQLQIKGTTMGSAVDFRNMLAFAEKHRIKPVVDRVYPLERGEEALSLMASSSQFGKIVLQL